jgi:hypothetical protein
MLKPVNYILPEYWASYLINNDSSGLSKDEFIAAVNFLIKNRLPFPVSCSEESYFSGSNDAGTFAGNVLEYTFLID